MLTTNLRHQITAGNNSTTAEYPAPFKLIRAAFVYVWVRKPDGSVLKLTRDTHYTVRVGDDSGGGVTLKTAYDGTHKVLVFRSIAFYLQEKDYIEDDDFPSENHEEGLDLAMAGVQEMAEILSRALLISFFEQAQDFTLPERVALAVLATDENKDLYWKLIDEFGTGGSIGAVRYDLAQSLLDSQRDRGARNVYGWHWQGQLGPTPPQDDLAFGAPYTRGDTLIVIGDPGGTTNIIDAQDRIRTLKNRTLLVCMVDDASGVWESFHPICPCDPYPIPHGELGTCGLEVVPFCPPLIPPPPGGGSSGGGAPP